MKPIHIIVLLSIAALSLFLAVSLFQEHKVEFHFNRIYKEGPKLIHDYKTGVAEPGFIRVYNDIMYVFDHATNAIKIYSPGGTLLSAINISAHQKRVGLIKNMDADGVSVRLIDVRNNGVFRYDQRKQMITFDSLGLIYDGAWPFPEKILFTSFDPVGRDIRLQTCNEANREKQTIHSPFTLYGDEGFANSGFFKKCNGKMLYALYQLGRFYVIDASLNHIDTFQTIDQYNIPPETIKEGTRTHLNSNKSLLITRNAACDSNFAYLLSNIRSVADKNISRSSVIVDVYDLHRRSYDHSFTLEKRDGAFNDMFIEGENLYVLTGKHILQFKL